MPDVAARAPYAASPDLVAYGDVSETDLWARSPYAASPELTLYGAGPVSDAIVAPPPPGDGATAGTAAGTCAVTATGILFAAAAGLAAGTCTATGSLVATGALAGAIAGTCTVTGAILATGALAGLATGTCTAAGTVLGAGVLAGTSAGTGTAVAALLGSGALAGTAAGTCATTATILADGALTGASEGTCSATATGLATLAASGTATGDSAATASLAGAGSVAGLAAGTCTAQGALRGAAILAGAAAGACAVTGSAVSVVPGPVTGLATGSCTVTGRVKRRWRHIMNYSISYSSHLAGVTGNIVPGDVLCRSPLGSYQLADSDAIAAGGVPLAIALSAGNGSIPVTLQYVGEVDSTIADLGAGVSALAVVTSTGRLARQGTPDPADVVVGEVDVNGNVALAFSMQSRTIRHGSAAPTTGDWLLGEVVFNVAPEAGGFLGWVCTASGTPGTWKTFGAISP